MQDWLSLAAPPGLAELQKSLAGDLVEVCLAQGVSAQLGLGASPALPLAVRVTCSASSRPAHTDHHRTSQHSTAQQIPSQNSTLQPIPSHPSPPRAVSASQSRSILLSPALSTCMSVVAPDNKGHSVFLESVFSPRQNYTFSMGCAGEKMII